MIQHALKRSQARLVTRNFIEIQSSRSLIGQVLDEQLHWSDYGWQMRSCSTRGSVIAIEQFSPEAQKYVEVPRSNWPNEKQHVAVLRAHLGFFVGDTLGATWPEATQGDVRRSFSFREGSGCSPNRFDSRTTPTEAPDVTVNEEQEIELLISALEIATTDFGS
jgi:hypothetical protein